MPTQRVISSLAAAVATVGLFSLTACGNASDDAAGVDRSQLPGAGKYCSQELDSGQLNICAELGKQPTAIDTTVVRPEEISSAGTAFGSTSFGFTVGGETLKAVCLRADTEQVGVIVPSDRTKSVQPGDIDYFTTRGGKVVGFVRANSLKGGDASLWGQFDGIEQSIGTDDCDDSRILLSRARDELRRPKK